MQDPQENTALMQSLLLPEGLVSRVALMDLVMQPDKLRTRILLWAKEEIALKHIPLQSIPILEKILLQGEIERGEIPGLFPQE